MKFSKHYEMKMVVTTCTFHCPTKKVPHLCTEMTTSNFNSLIRNLCCSSTPIVNHIDQLKLQQNITPTKTGNPERTYQNKKMQILLKSFLCLHYNVLFFFFVSELNHTQLASNDQGIIISTRTCMKTLNFRG